MVIFFFNFLCRRDRSRTCLVCGHFSFDVASLHEMPSVSQSSCSQFFIEEDFSLLRLPPHVGRYKLSVRGKVMKFYIYIYIFFFFNLISLHAFLLDGPFRFFFVIVFYYFFDLCYTV